MVVDIEEGNQCFAEKFLQCAKKSANMLSTAGGFEAVTELSEKRRAMKRDNIRNAEYSFLCGFTVRGH